MAVLEGWMVFFSMSGSVEGGSEERKERCFRKGKRMLRAIVGTWRGFQRYWLAQSSPSVSTKTELALSDLGG